MNHVQISHPALVALQGRLRGAAERLTQEGNDPERRIDSIDDLYDATAEIDQWLTDPAKQVSEK